MQEESNIKCLVLCRDGVLMSVGPEVVFPIKAATGFCLCCRKQLAKSCSSVAVRNEVV